MPVPSVKRLFTFIFFVVTLSALQGCSDIPYFSQSQPQTVVDKSSLTRTLTDSLGITSAQAEGGAGALLNVASNALSSTDFSKITSSIPDASNLLSAVPALSKKGTSSAGLSDAYGYLTNQFQGLGLSNSMINSMGSVLVDYLSNVSGTQVSQLFQSALTSTLTHSAGSLMSPVSM